MSLLFNNKYRIPSARMQNWDYSWVAAYFITICTARKEHYFGEIKDKKMHLSKAGVLADVFWHEIKNHTKNVELDAFVVMPNHIHGILILNPPVVETGHALSSHSQSPHAALLSDMQETRHALSLPENKPSCLSIAQQRFRNQGKNTVSSILGSYKSAVTKHANRMGFTSGWQTRFHDHVIRSDESYTNIVKYIESNVANWKDDKFFS